LRAEDGLALGLVLFLISRAFGLLGPELRGFYDGVDP
jgi:hypothetical protein